MPRKPKPIADRLKALSAVDALSNVKNGKQCRIWFGKLNERGYGYIREGKRMRRAHRVAYELAHCEIVPSGVPLCHACDTPACIEPAHLSKCSHRINAYDRQIRFRRKTKLSVEQVLEMRRLNKCEGIGVTELGVRYGVDHSSASRAVRGLHWPWIAA